METLNFDTLRRNAYRTLGLTGAATQEQIESAARMLRLLSSGEVPPTANDAYWLGPVPRSTNDIESALMRLTDPESRARERLWWYSDKPPATDAPEPASTAGSRGARVRQLHDEALTTLYGLLIAGADRHALSRWRDALEQCREVAGSDDYLQWMLAVERNGDFEKPANLEELARLQGEFADHASTALVATADDCLAEKDFAGAGKVIQVLRGAAADRAGAASQAVERILDRFEDSLIGQCNDQVALVDEAWKTKRVERLKPACLRALDACENGMSTLSRELTSHLSDPDRAQRVRGQLVAVYLHVADAYEACHDKWSSRQALMKSLPMAAGLPMEPRIRQRINALTGAKPVKEAATTGGGYRDYSSGGTRGVGVLIVIVISIVVRMCVSNINNSPSSSFDRPTPNISLPDMDEMLKNLRANHPEFSPNGPDLHPEFAPTGPIVQPGGAPATRLMAPPISLRSDPGGQGLPPLIGPASQPGGLRMGPAGLPGLPGGGGPESGRNLPSRGG